MSTLLALRATSEANTAEQKRTSDRKRNILVLVHSYLIENGYFESATCLNTESTAVCTKYEVADNVDLGLILVEYENYYEMRFDKKPKLVRKLNDGEEPKFKSRAVDSKRNSSSNIKKSDGNNSNNSNKPGAVPQVTIRESASDEGGTDMGVQGIRVNAVTKKEPEVGPLSIEDRILKPPPQFGNDVEMKQLVGIVSREIYQHSPNVRFDDIVGLENAKRLLKEAIQLPLSYPTIFTGILRPWKGILLHGPPGTGKTLLAKAVAAECNTTFFNISASTLVSKWRGDSEKLVRVLFDLAYYHAPSTIFLDEIDAILSSRGGETPGGEHEASRRMKTELLIQMDGMRDNLNTVSSTAVGSHQIFVMAASNLPWDLDVAVLRRLEKRVLVSLPSIEAREKMIRKHLEDRAVEDLPYSMHAASTEGYSGADLELVCREAAMMPVRRLLNKLHDLQNTQGESNRTSIALPRTLRSKFSNERVDVDSVLKADSVSAEDLSQALDSTKPSSGGSISRYQDWQRDFGSV
jgi:katanin p60 ATPase-containing subunit A1